MSVLRMGLWGLVVLLGVLLTPWAFTMLWNWFVVPLGFRPTGYVNSMGFLLLVNLVASWKDRPARNDLNDPKRTLKRGAIKLVVGPLFVVLVGTVLLAFRPQ